MARLLDRYLGKPTASRVLDVAAVPAGTPGVGAPGVSCRGSDLSADMVAVARERAKSLGLSIDFHNESFQSCDRIGRKYDAVLRCFRPLII